MKKTLAFSLLLWMLSSCSFFGSGDAETTDPELLSLYGMWVGDLELPQGTLEWKPGKKLNLTIKKITADHHVYGVSIVAGTKREVSGTAEMEDSKVSLKLREPGDHKWDGEFLCELEMSNEGLWQLRGTWQPNKPTKTLGPKVFALRKKEFKYDMTAMLPDSYYVMDESDKKTIKVSANYLEEFEEDTTNADTTSEPESYDVDQYAASTEAVSRINASVQTLTEDQLKELTKLDLEIIRNTIYARHGYNFKKARTREFFNQVDWYFPVSNDVTKQLTPVEKKNIKLIKKFENYASNYYDSFGR